MMKLNTYINFGGRCQEALEFYKKCFGGEIVSLQTFGESPSGDMPEQFKQEQFKQLVMHAEFRAEEIYFMATDGDPGGSVTSGDSISLSINFTDT